MTGPTEVKLPSEKEAGRRRVEPELLDELPADDPRAIRSRRDLQRVNAWMGNGRIVFRMLRGLPSSRLPKSVVEIGGGDGTFLLGLARQLGLEWQGVSARLIDRQRLVHAQTTARFQALKWQVHAVETDVFDWLANMEPADLILANLFLHHFPEERLVELFRLLATKTTTLVACEPHRFAFPTLAGGCVVLIGCSAVTRHDAIASIRAGFVRQELSALWPKDPNWRLVEGKAGWCSHSFWASRD
jgi:hypothetical protein